MHQSVDTQNRPAYCLGVGTNRPPPESQEAMPNLSNATIAQLVCAHEASGGRACPFCGATDGIESNGGTEYNLTYGCHGADGCCEQWDANEWVLTNQDFARMVRSVGFFPAEV